MRGPSGRTGRGLVVAAGALLALAGLAAVGAHVAQQADGGWFASSTERFSTPTSVLVTDEILVEEGRPGDPPTDLGELAEVRIRATPAEPGRPVFVGIGPKADVDAYLGGTAHDRVANFDLEPFAVRFDRVPGGPAPAPAAQPFWVATASGPGTQTLLWDKTRGAWSAVVMNADGSPGVDVRADVGLRFGFLLPLGVALLAAAALVAAGPSLLRRARSANAARRE